MRKLIVNKGSSSQEIGSMYINNLPIVTENTQMGKLYGSRPTHLLDSNDKRISINDIERDTHGRLKLTINGNAVLTSDEIWSKKEDIIVADLHTLDAKNLKTIIYHPDVVINGLEILSKWDILEINYPIGYYYTQYADPGLSYEFYDLKDPSYLFGGRWESIFEGESIFFRTKGSHSNVERERGGFQNDALIYHKHDTIMGSHYHGISSTDYGNGSTPSFPRGDDNKYGTVNTYSANLGTKTSGYPVTIWKTPLETRVRNRLIKIWSKRSHEPRKDFSLSIPES